MVSLLLTLNNFTSFCIVDIVDFKQENIYWDGVTNLVEFPNIFMKSTETLLSSCLEALVKLLQYN